MGTFKQNLEKTKRGEVNDLLATARKTTIEHDYLVSCLNSLVDADAAKTALNSTIEFMGKAELTIEDIDPTLWSFVARVLRGVPFRD